MSAGLFLRTVTRPQDVESLQKIAPDCGMGFCDGCFTEKYPIPMEAGGED